MPLVSSHTATLTYGTYILFFNLGTIPGGKTNLYEVWTKNEDDSVGDIKLGEIKWFGRFRKYSWFPAAGMVFEEVCNQEITDFLKQENIVHRGKRRAANV